MPYVIFPRVAVTMMVIYEKSLDSHEIRGNDDCVAIS